MPNEENKFLVHQVFLFQERNQHANSREIPHKFNAKRVVYSILFWSDKQEKRRSKNSSIDVVLFQIGSARDLESHKSITSLNAFDLNSQ